MEQQNKKIDIYFINPQGEICRDKKLWFTQSGSEITHDHVSYELIHVINLQQLLTVYGLIG